VRFPLSGCTRYGGTGQGSGGCNDDLGQNGQDWFNNAAINHLTCALEWGPGILDFHCWDGLYTLAAVKAGAAAGKLVASYQYPIPGNVPPPGTERWHFNLWAANAGAPQWGRRSHEIVTNFEFQTAQVNFGDGNSGLQRRLSASIPHDGNVGLASIADAMPVNPNTGFLSESVTKGASTGAAPLGTATAVGIAVGASALTAPIEGEGKSEGEAAHHEAGGRRRKERAAVAPAQ
jgi:hypothetical protein